MAVFPAPYPDNIYSLRIYQTAALTANFADNQFPFWYPKDGAIVAVADRRQAHSHGIRLRVTAGGGDNLDFSFDGINIHGHLAAGEQETYYDRYEGGICVRGQGTFFLEAW